MAFTLAEALVATSIMATLGAALLLAVATTMQTTVDSVDRSIAGGIAQQLLDEVAGARYCAAGASPRQWPMGPNVFEWPARDKYDDIDDFVLVKSQPPVDRFGVNVGEENGKGAARHQNFRVAKERMAAWSTQIEVYYVDDADLTRALPSGQTSYHRAVRVRVFRALPDKKVQTLADQRRVYSYVPTP